MTTYGQQELWIGNQGQGKGKEVDIEEDGETTFGLMEEQHGPCSSRFHETLGLILSRVRTSNPSLLRMGSMRSMYLETELNSSYKF